MYYTCQIEPGEVQKHPQTQIEAAPGFKYITVSFEALLTCIVSWLAGEKWRVEALSDHTKDFYTILASKLSASYTVSSDVDLRGILENVDLGLCLGELSCPDLAELGIDRKKTFKFVQAWKKANPEVSGTIRRLASYAAGKPLSRQSQDAEPFRFEKQGDDLFVQLPSGRKLLFREAVSGVDVHNDRHLQYERYAQEGNSCRVASGWDLLKMIANETAIDLLNSFILTALNCEDYRIVSNRFHEIVLEVPDHVLSQYVATDLLGDLPVWTHGIPLRVEASECTRMPSNDPTVVWKRSTIMGSHVFMALDYMLTPENNQQDHPEE